MKRLTLTLGLVVLAAVTAACSSASANPSAPAGSVDPNAPVVVAQGNAFSPATVTVPADKAFSLTLDNKDGAPHNVSIYTDSGASKSISFAVVGKWSSGRIGGNHAKHLAGILLVHRRLERLAGAVGRKSCKI